MTWVLFGILWGMVVAMLAIIFLCVLRLNQGRASWVGILIFIGFLVGLVKLSFIAERYLWSKTKVSVDDMWLFSNVWFLSYGVILMVAVIILKKRAKPKGSSKPKGSGKNGA